MEAFTARCHQAVCAPLWQDTSAQGARLLVANGVVYAVAASSVLADNASTGQRQWQTSLTNDSTGAPTVADGTVYAQDAAADKVLAFHL